MAAGAVVDPRRLARRALRDHDVGRCLSPRGGPLISRRLALPTGLTYHVLEWGEHAAPDAVTFVLVHGFLDLGYGWRQVAERLASHARVIAPDLRGHGDSDWIGAGGYYHFFDYAADLDAVIARLARGRVVLVGHSMGGSIAQYWAGARPDRLAALALLEGLGPPDQADADVPRRTASWFDAWASTRRAPRVMASIEDAAHRLRKHDALLADGLARELAIAGTRPFGVGIAWKHDPLHATMGPYPFRNDTAALFRRRITCPVLVVDGAQSAMNLPVAERAARRADLRDHRYLVLERSGHMLQRHQPAELADALLALAGVAG